ncbi:MAG: hypothetical protein GTO45_06210 [Candidatus Aminicenantes bacterium]|nr:hypothetical protein [Candidatus Aminicenantes bacterium]NIM78417.1 hypothetical protein [Candidatus Aminicenantes bacterium]NIN17679.1 hypothetical protein [Candidatus Aminicenantes bacterium]NIN41555.1 hypothetical protein [Candidatus Aminicenantes bacterium]NIN84329.1 hypothetical protein [Candidatus Aminicenantes bacterium]
MFRKAFRLVLASLFVFFFFCQAQASALVGPSVSIDVPESASGVITAVVKYSFPEFREQNRIYLRCKGQFNIFLAKSNSSYIKDD